LKRRLAAKRQADEFGEQWNVAGLQRDRALLKFIEDDTAFDE